MKENELMHYGVPGMRWGVRRNRQQLVSKSTKYGNKMNKLETKRAVLIKKANNYNTKSIKTQSHNEPYERKLAKNSAKKAKWDLKAQKQLNERHTNFDKVGKYQAKSAKYNKNIMKAQKKLKHNKWAIKENKIRNKAEKAQIKIEKNKKLKSKFDNTIRDLDAGIIDDGNRFIMKYAKPDKPYK